MEIIKKKISLRDIAQRSVNFKLMLQQDIDNLGIMTDMEYDTSNPIRDTILSDWYKQAGVIKAVTDSKLNRVQSYDSTEPYKKDFDIDKEEYRNYKNEIIDGVDRVTNIDGDEITYVIGGNRDSKLGTEEQVSGFLFIDNPKNGLELNNAIGNENMTTSIQYVGEGWNSTNISLEPQIQEEYLLGIINQPEVKSDVFIDRGSVSVLDKHLRLSEIESLDHLTRYGNGFYNINRD